MSIMDGHFWIVKDGKIHDWDYPEYELVRKINGCTDKKHYKEADQTTQTTMTSIMSRYYIEACSKYGLTDMGSIVDRWNYEPMFGHCFMNCLKWIEENGGELKFGSMGWQKPNGKVHWEFGGEDWKGAHMFLRKK